MTFGDFDLRLDGQRCTVVGPNGAGKSNITRVVDLVRIALDSVSEGYGSPRWRAADQVLRSYAAARHHGERADRAAIVRLAVELTTAAERAQMTAFVRAALLHTLIQEVAPGNVDARLVLAEWAEREITQEGLSALFSGVIVLRHAGMPQAPWEISYEFHLDGAAYSWLLASPGMSHGIVRADSRRPVAARQTLAERLFGMSKPGGPSVDLPVPLPGFDLARMCPGEGVAVAEPTLHFGTGIIDQQFTVFRRAIEMLGLPTPETGGQRTFPLAYALSAILVNGVIIVGEQLRGLGAGGSAPQQPGPYPWEALASPARSMAPWQLPLRLFELKNGSPPQRARYQAVQAAFSRLVPGRVLDVKFQATTTDSLGTAPAGTGRVAMLGQRTDNDSGGPDYPVAIITVVIDRPDGTGLHPDDLAVQLHGAGTWEALVIAEALADAAGRLVILDEPAVTLHPTWQRALRTMIGEAEGQFLVITHSADLVPMGNADDLASLVRIENETGQSRAHRFDRATLARDDVSRITREFALSADAVSLLFARGVVLVEGETELGALPEWFTRHAHSTACKSPAELDLAFWSVGGDSNFRTYLTVLRALGIPWVVICDGAAFDVEKRQARNPHIFDQVLKAGISSPGLARFMQRLETGKRKRVMNRRMFTDERKLAAQAGIFTLAHGWTTASKTSKTPGDESFEAFVEGAAPGKLHQAAEEAGDSKVRKGRWLATTVACPPEVADLYDKLTTELTRQWLAQER